jgi:hypothetical protein
VTGNSNPAPVGLRHQVALKWTLLIGGVYRLDHTVLNGHPPIGFQQAKARVQPMNIT